MYKTDEVILVEGKYDKIKLESVIDANILVLNGFSIFNDREKQTLIRRLAEQRGIVILTDSDSAGFLLRNRIKAFVPPEYIKNAYIPDVYGKEKRKSTYSKEGKIGVEGIDGNVLLQALINAGVVISDCPAPNNTEDIITKTDFYNKGLSGKSNSKALRKKCTDFFGLPERLTANQLLEVLNIIISKQDFMNLDF